MFKHAICKAEMNAKEKRYSQNKVILLIDKMKEDVERTCNTVNLYRILQKEWMQD